MILAREDTIRAHVAAGAWGHAPLDLILRRGAAAHPDRLAVMDGPDRAAWTSGEPRRLAWAEAEAQVASLAALLSDLGLAPDAVLVMQMPATIDGVLLLLGAWRAGLIAAPLPLAWRERDVAEAAMVLGASAVATVARIEGEPFGERMREVAADVFTIRHALGTGGNLPDGFLDLDRATEGVTGAAPADPLPGAADRVAVVTFAGAAGHPVAVPRSHNQLIATGLGLALEARLEQGAALLSPLAPSGVGALASGLVPWLLTGGTLILDGPRSLERWAGLARETAADAVVAPAPLAARLAGRLAAEGSPASLIPVWPGRHDPDRLVPRGRAVIDLSVLDEFAVVPRARGGDGLLAPLPAGPWPAGGNGPVLVELDMAASGRNDGSRPEILARGAMVPEKSWPTSSGRAALWGIGRGGFVPTGLRALPGEGGFFFGGPCGDVLDVGRSFAAADELDRLLRTAPGVADAAVYLDAAGELAVALVPSDGASLDFDALRAEIAGLRLGAHCAPRAFRLVDAIPRDDRDRVDRALLAEGSRG